MPKQVEIYHDEIDYSQLTPYNVMRMTNCKTSKFFDKETYPNIQPPVSKCSNIQTGVWLADAVEDAGCGRPFGTEQDDDLLEAWKQSPNKHTLSCYGIVSDIPSPDSMVFNQVLTDCLHKVNGTAKCRKSKTPPQPYNCRKDHTKRKGSYVLNRKALQTKLNKMPVVQKKLGAKNALTWLYCGPPADPDSPFLDDDFGTSLETAFDMERPAPKQRHGLRRKHRYCELQCGIAENKCTEFEWKKYKEDPLAYEVAYKMEMEEMERQSNPQPKDYDELYLQLVSCFEKTNNNIPMCDAYIKCCKMPYEQLQGCGEHELEAPSLCGK